MDARPLIAALALAVPAVAASPAAAQSLCGTPPLPACPSPTPLPTATPSPTPPPATGPARAEVSLTASRSRLFYVSPERPRLRLSGRLRSSAPVRDVALELVGRTPSGRVALRVRTRTDAAGRYDFGLRPSVSADYQVRVRPRQDVEGRSVTRRVRLQPDVRVGNAADASGLRIRGVVLTPNPPRPAVRPGRATRGHFYLQLRGNAYFQRVGKAGVGPIRCDDVDCRRRSSYLVRERSLLRRAERVLVCFGGKPFRDAGSHGRCPARFDAG